MNFIPEDEVVSLTETTERLTLATDDNTGTSNDTPTVTCREVLVVENKGIKVSYDGATFKTMGRVTVATRSFDTLYVPILREKPAIICASGDHLGYLEQFLDAPEQVQLGILDCFAQPLESPVGQALMEPAKLMFLLGVLDDFSLIHRLLSIYATNAHQYRETSDEKSSGNVGKDEGIGCLPIYGSKLSHSCDGGNVGYSSHAADGCVEYSVIKPIPKGNLVSFTYLADLFETPTPERRQILFDTKHFWCECERCCGPDYCRFLPCPECSTLIPCVYEKGNSDPLWKCRSCGPDCFDNDFMLVLERQMEQTLKMIERSVEKLTNFKKIPEFTPADLQDLVQECSQTLSPTHYLTIKALRLLVTICTCSAYVQTNRLVARGGWTNPQVLLLHRHGIEASFRLILACECVAAGCPGCTSLVVSGMVDISKDGTVVDDIFPHVPLFDRAAPLHRACEELTEYLPPHYWPSYAVSIFTRYLPLSRIKFGRDSLVAMEKKLLPWKEAICLPIGTLWSGSP